MIRKATKRLTFVKRLYKGVTLEDAAGDVGGSASTARRWNEGGLGQLTLKFGAGRRPKFGEDKDRRLELLRDGQPWKAQETYYLLRSSEAGCWSSRAAAGKA